MAHHSRAPMFVSDVLQRLHVGDDVNAFQDNNTTWLMQAVKYHQTDLVQFLLSNGANPTLGAKEGPCGLPIYHAIEQGYEDILDLLLMYGANMNLVELNHNCVRVALNLGHLGIFYVLLNHGFNPNYLFSDSFNSEPLLNAVVRLRMDNLMDRLIELHVNVNATDNKNRSSLVYAVNNRDLSSLQKLLKVGANPNSHDTHGTYLLTYAIRTKFIPIIIELIFANVNMELMDTSNILGNALHVAVSSNQLYLFLILMDCGADLNNQNSDGLSVVDVCMVCCKFSQFDTATCKTLVKGLFMKGARITNMVSYPYIDNDFYDYGSRNLLQLLIDEGLRIRTNFEDIVADPPLHRAIHHYDRAFFKYLVQQHNLDINMTNYLGNTTFICAAQTREIPTMKYLLDLGANVNYRNKQNISALQYTVDGFDLSSSFVWLIQFTAIDVILQVLEYVTLHPRSKYQCFIIKHFAQLDLKSPITNISENLSSISAVSLRFFHVCQAELRLLKTSFVDNISLYNIFSVTKDSLLARNKMMLTYITSYEFRGKFKIFCSDLETRFAEAASYQNAVELATQSLCRLTNLQYNSHHIIIEKICSMLDRCDILNLGAVYMHEAP